MMEMDVYYTTMPFVCGKLAVIYEWVSNGTMWLLDVFWLISIFLLVLKVLL